MRWECLVCIELMIMEDEWLICVIEGNRVWIKLSLKEVHKYTCLCESELRQGRTLIGWAHKEKYVEVCRTKRSKELVEFVWPCDHIVLGKHNRTEYRRKKLRCRHAVAEECCVPLCKEGGEWTWFKIFGVKRSWKVYQLCIWSRMPKNFGITKIPNARKDTTWWDMREKERSVEAKWQICLLLFGGEGRQLQE